MSILDLFLYLTFLNWSIVTALWFYCKKENKLDFLAFYWGLGIVVLAWSSMLIEALLEDPAMSIRQLITNSLVSLWGIRLSIYLATRRFWNEDPRHESVKKDMEKNWGVKSYKNIFLFQGLIQLIVIAPILYINFLPGPKILNFLDFLGIFIFIVGFFLETKADQNLKQFRRLPENESKILQTGLWKYCRHPNYFGDILQWWAIYLLACSAVGGMWSIFGPLLMTWIFVTRSINLIENRLITNRPHYDKYIKSTNKILPDLKIIYPKVFGLMQYAIPHKMLTMIAGYCCSSKNSLLKNFLIYMFCFFYKPNLNEAKKVKIKEFESFNDFFTRKLRPESRSINSSESTLVSPVDGKIVSLGKITNGLMIQAKNINYDLKTLLEDEYLEELFQNGSYLTIYLAPFDYHRIHFPMKGVIKKTKHFPGSFYSVNESSLTAISSLYTKNERTLVYVESEDINYSLISVGASMVGSVIPFWLNKQSHGRKSIVSAWNEGPLNDLNKIKKGQELGYFQMGSTVILLFPGSIKFNNNFLSLSKNVKLGEVLIDLQER